MNDNRLTNEDNYIFNMYELLNDLFSLNYTCLRMANQEKPIDTAQTVITADELFRSNENKKSVWIDMKLQDSAELRNEVFDEILTAWEMEKEQYFNEEELLKTLTTKKRTLMTYYNIAFKEKSSFKDCFDGFNAINPEFAKIARDFDTKAIFTTENADLNRLMHAYYDYINFLKTLTAHLSFDQISTILKNDLTGAGRPSIYFKRHGNDDILTMTGEEIEEFVLDSEDVLKKVEQEIKTENKKLVPLYKRRKKNPYDYTIHDEISKIKSVIFNLLEKQKQAEHYNFYACELLQRYLAANTDYDASKWHDLVEGFFDLTAGINVFKKENKLEIDKVYVHKLEMSYLTYLKNMFQDSPALASEKTETENQKI